MRSYELAYIADPEMDEQALDELEGKVKDWIKAAGGTPGKVNHWGKRRLAYEINKKSEGYYFIIPIEMPSQAGNLIERDLRLSEQILRYMITLQQPS